MLKFFYHKYLKEHALGSRIKTILFHRSLGAYRQLVSCLKSISKDQEFIDKNEWYRKNNGSSIPS